MVLCSYKPLQYRRRVRFHDFNNPIIIPFLEFIDRTDSTIMVLLPVIGLLCSHKRAQCWKSSFPAPAFWFESSFSSKNSFKQERRNRFSSLSFGSRKQLMHYNAVFENQKLHPTTLCFVSSLLRHPDPTQFSQWFRDSKTRFFKSRALVQFSLLLK